MNYEKSELCNRECKNITSLSSHIRQFHKIKIKEYYDKFMRKDKEGICYCGKETKFNGLKGYLSFCSTKCSNTHDTTKQKQKTTLSKNYGDFGLSHPDIKKRRITTNQKKYGVNNPSQSNLIKIRKKETYIKHYGVENPNQSKEIREKTKRTCLERYGKENVFQVPHIQDKYKQTLLNRYGVDCNWRIPGTNEKKQLTYLKNYGFDNFAKTDKGRQISRENCIRLIEIQKLNGSPLGPRIGLQEPSFFKELEKHTQFKIRIQNKIIGYFPDGYIPELNLFILFDERSHFEDKNFKVYKKRDIKCTIDLASCASIVFRVSEKDWKENKQKVINNFKLLIQELVLCKN